MDDETKQWKISNSDFEERQFWEDYQQAYEDLIDKCSNSTCPWYEFVHMNSHVYSNVFLISVLEIII